MTGPFSHASLSLLPLLNLMMRFLSPFSYLGCLTPICERRWLVDELEVFNTLRFVGAGEQADLEMT